ncbi:CinA family nicotinamide mononucleotide deamidase-related protein [Pseudaeromonas sp. ZJS20]|uniref:CinA family nicotinamide mononucleotide deamidase-related protein n=1 Tax=Pseudaeromonas aegiceratis TaxID=3153928 RepID=UPI00390CD625
MHIEVITTGDEVLTGFIVDSNAAWLCQRLLAQGLQVQRRQTVGDELAQLIAILQERSQFADVIIVNGGLGPTSDDKTTEAAALAAGVGLELDTAWLAQLEARYASRGRPMPSSNRKQAMLPAGATKLDNPIGTACGFALQIGRARCFFTPGVPNEFFRMVDEQILPRLATGEQSHRTEVRRYFTFGVSESALSDQLDNLSWPPHIVLGYRSAMPLIEIKLISQQADKTDFAQAEQQLLPILAPYLVGQGDWQMAMDLQQRLGTRALVLHEDASQGLLLRQLAPALPQMTAHFGPLPANAVGLLETLQQYDGLHLAVGRASEAGIPLALWDGQQGMAQTLNIGLQDQQLHTTVISFAALHMLQRHLQALPAICDYQTLKRSELRQSKLLG